MLEVLQVEGQLVGDHGLHGGLDLGIAQLALGLALELGVFDHHQQHAGHALAEVLAGQVIVLVLEGADAAGVFVEHLGQGGLRADLVGAALPGRDVVDVGEEGVRIAVRVLDGHLHLDVVLDAGQEDGLFVDGALALVEEADIVDDAALEAVFPAGGLRVLLPLVLQGDFEALVQIGQLLQAAADRLVLKLRGVKDPVVRQEADQGAALPSVADPGQGHRGDAGLHLAFIVLLLGGELHLPVGIIPVDVHGQPAGQGVDDGSAHPVQAAGIGVVVVAELAARVKAGKNQLHAGNAGGLVDVHRHAAAVVPHGGGAVLVQRHLDLGGIAAHGLVDGVVHDFPQKMMQAPGTRGPDIHARPDAHRVQPLEHLQTVCIVLRHNCSFTVEKSHNCQMRNS